jgi:hypothetical protein
VSVSDPGPDPDADLEHLRTTLQHASTDASRDIATTLDSLTDAPGRLDADDDAPAQDDLESIRAELARLEETAEGDTGKRLDRARREVRTVLKARLTAEDADQSR